MKVSRIGWTDYSGGPLNFVRGCTPVSEGCENCYARAIYERFGRDFTQVTIDEGAWAGLDRLTLPQDGNKRGPHSRPMAFVCDTGDLFHEDVPRSVQYQVVYTMIRRPDITWQILTKRAERMRAFVKNEIEGPLPPNVWLGVTCENQARADERIPILLDTPAAVRFVSVEPLLAPVDLRERLGAWAKGGAFRDDLGQQHHHAIRGLDWVICGAESGPHRRPFDVTWALDLYEQCKAAEVPFFYKQGSALRPGQEDALPGVGQVKEWPG